MDLNLDGRVALVTAASRGLGRACAQALGSEGVRVGVGARDLAALDGLASEIRSGPGSALCLPLDLRRPGSVEAAVERVIEEWGRLDILIANAPGPVSGPVEQVSIAAWRDALEVNLLAMVRLVNAALPQMRQQGWGRIVFITTVGVMIAQPAMVLSNAVRLAVTGLAKTLALEVADSNILVNVLAPGPIDTDRMQELVEQTAQREQVDLATAERQWLDDVPLGRMGVPRDVASMALLLSSDACAYTTGAVIPVDGGKAKGFGA